MRSETAIVTAPNSNVMSGSKPTFITKRPMQFLIMDAPRATNLHLYIKECKKLNVTDIVRVCEPTYLATDLERAGISLHEMPYPDGHSPPDEVLDRWLKLVDETFYNPTALPSPVIGGTGGTSSTTHSGVNGSAKTDALSVSHSKLTTDPTIAVHCVAGLGRAPVLVAIALIEFAKMEPVDAATFIRKHRRGAINNMQLDWLEKYKRRYKRNKSSAGASCCVVM